MFEFYEVSGQDGRLRIAVDAGEDEPPYMHGIAKYQSGTAIYKIVLAVVTASDPERDELGLYWSDRVSCRKALAAARKVAAAKGRGA